MCNRIIISTPNAWLFCQNSITNSQSYFSVSSHLETITKMNSHRISSTHDVYSLHSSSVTAHSQMVKQWQSTHGGLSDFLTPSISSSHSLVKELALTLSITFHLTNCAKSVNSCLVTIVARSFGCTSLLPRSARTFLHFHNRSCIHVLLQCLT